MKKEVIIAVIAGFILGGGAAVAAVNLPSLFKSQNKPVNEETSEEPSPQPTTIETASESILEISDPLDESIFFDRELKISGKTRIGDALLIESENDITAGVVKDDGTFSAGLTLSEGGNTITVYSVNDQGEEIKSITVYYTSDKL